MKNILHIAIRAVIIAVVFSLVGLGLNAVSPSGLPLIYNPPEKLVVSGVSIPLINEVEARRFLEDPSSVFVDTRNEEDFVERHVKGAVFLNPNSVEERFPEVQPLIPEESRVILYCYGPECDMAERVAQFLAQLGYKNMMIMSAGFKSWEKAGFPSESSKRRERS
jgi:rhodanese-related sulfurtransferase